MVAGTVTSGRLGMLLSAFRIDKVDSVKSGVL